VAKVSFKLRGFEEYLAKLEQAGKDVDQAAENAVVTGRDVLYDGYSQRVPKDSGDLERLMTTPTEPQREGNYVFNEIGLPSRAEAARRGFNAKEAEEISRYGMAQEYGKANMQAQSYIRPTHDADAGKMRKAQRQSLEQDGVL
jgi:hypothetical protein